MSCNLTLLTPRLVLLSGFIVAVSARADLIELNTGALHTDSPQARALEVGDASFSGKQLFLLQFPGPMRDVSMAKLQVTGAQVLNAIPHNAYLIYADAQAARAIQELVQAGVASWFGNLTAAAKLQIPLEEPALQSESARTFDVQLVRDLHANTATEAFLIQNNARIIDRFDVLGFRNLVLQMQPAQLDALLNRADVISVNVSPQISLLDERQSVILAGDLNINSEPNSGNYLHKLSQWGFTQQQFRDSGLIVDVTDSGVDRHPIGADPGTMPLGANAGPVAARHFSFYENGDPALRSRFIYKGNWTAIPDNSLAFDGHGLLDMSIVGGFVPDSFDPTNTLVHRDAQGFRYGMGVAPFVGLGNTVMLTASSSFTSAPAMVSGAHASGARISTNSWGGQPGVYNSTAQTYDALTRDARTDVALDQPMFFLFAAGNVGPDPGTIISPSTAKNVLAVGASENVRSVAESAGGIPGNLNGASQCGDSDADANSANDMTFFSARGPTSDGRQKPEIVAPGSHITGASLVAPELNPLLPVNNLGQNDPGNSGSGLCGQLGNGQVGGAFNYFPFTSGQRWYAISSGTSHATPAVAGGAALIYQQFLNNPSYLAQHRTPAGRAAPSPALTKAYILNTARYLPGALANDSLPSTSQGMGAMNLSTAFDGVSRVTRDQVPDDTFTDSGQSRVFTFSVVDSTKPVRVSLVYTDAPGSTIGSAYVNDLDLTLVQASTQYLGNVFFGAFSIQGGQADSKNNHEHVFLPAGLAANTTVDIRIDARAINGNGVPSNQDATDQDFALVAYNVRPLDFLFASGFE